MQRLCIKFSRREEVKFLSHLDLMRLWERALRRARLPLAYSEGFAPRCRISLAAPLPLGVTSETELLDVFLSRWLSPQAFAKAVEPQLPSGITILDTQVVGLHTPSLQSQVRWAEYQVGIETSRKREEIEKAIASLLASKSFPWQHSRDTGVRSYDLRALVQDLWLLDWHDSLCTLGMRLQCDSSGAGRPEQVVAALGFSQRPKYIHRTKLNLASLPKP